MFEKRSRLATLFSLGFSVGLWAQPIEAKQAFDPRRMDFLEDRVPDTSPQRSVTEGVSKGKRPKLPEPKLSVVIKDHLCVADEESQGELMEAIEVNLELQTIVESLTSMGGPRVLSLSQKYFLSQVPFCDPFATNLQRVSQLIHGSDRLR